MRSLTELYVALTQFSHVVGCVSTVLKKAMIQAACNLPERYLLPFKLLRTTVCKDCRLSEAPNRGSVVMHKQLDTSKKFVEHEYNIPNYSGTNKILSLLNTARHVSYQLQDRLHLDRVLHSLANARSSTDWLPMSYLPRSLHQIMVLLTCILVDSWQVDILSKLPSSVQGQSLTLLKKAMVQLCHAMSYNAHNDLRPCRTSTAHHAALAQA